MVHNNVTGLLSNVQCCMFSLRDYFLFCSHSMPNNNDGKDLARCLDKRHTHYCTRRRQLSFFCLLCSRWWCWCANCLLRNINFAPPPTSKSSNPVSFLCVPPVDKYHKNTSCTWLLGNFAHKPEPNWSFCNLSIITKLVVVSICLKWIRVTVWTGQHFCFCFFCQSDWKRTLNGPSRDSGGEWKHIQLSHLCHCFS